MSWYCVECKMQVADWSSHLARYHADERREGRSDGREDARKSARLGILAGALRRRDERLQRATRAVERLGEGAVYGTDVLLSVEAAERLADDLQGAKKFYQDSTGLRWWPRGGRS